MAKWVPGLFVETPQAVDHVLLDVIRAGLLAASDPDACSR
jgi:hypothetical protein